MEKRQVEPTKIRWEVIEEIDYFDALQIFNMFDVETVHIWKEGKHRGETEFEICSCPLGFILIIRESFNDRELFFSVKNIEAQKQK
jgi:hypothetical protein